MIWFACRILAGAGLAVLLSLGTVCVTVLIHAGRPVPEPMWALMAAQLAALVWIVHTAPVTMHERNLAMPEKPKGPSAPT